MILIRATDAQILVSGDTYHAKDLLKLVPGMHWDSERKQWFAPRSFDTFQLVRRVLQGDEVELDPGAATLAMTQEMLDRAMLAKRATDLEIPAFMKTAPWTHQLQAYWFAKQRLVATGGAMLALDMGTGKTKVAIDLINGLAAEKRILITCPKSVLSVWPDEFEVHSCWPAPVYVCNPKHSVPRRAEEAAGYLQRAGSQGVIVVNHDALWRPAFKKFVLNTKWDFMVVDECHRAKAPGGKLSKMLALLASRIPMRIGLTGTPCPHDLLDMYAQGRFIDPTVYGTSNAIYKARYAQYMDIELKRGPRKGEKFPKLTRFQNTEEWQEKFHGLAIQVKADDVQDLPEVVHSVRRYDLDDAERALYDELRDEMIAFIKGHTEAVVAKNQLSMLVRLAQIAAGSVTTDAGFIRQIGTSKYEAIKDSTEDIFEPVVIFCRFRNDLNNVGKVAASLDRPHFELSGSEDTLEDWKAECRNNSNPIIGVQIQSGGVGISLVNSRSIIYATKDYNLGNYDQSLKRAHRPGQNKNVNIIHLLAKNTIEEKIHRDLLSRKVSILGLLREEFEW